jgi:hypothetical protein
MSSFIASMTIKDRLMVYPLLLQYRHMKKLLWIIASLSLTVTMGVHALSFWPDTIFLQATTEETCSDMGWSFTEWYGAIYCTTTPSQRLTEDEQRVVTLAAQKITTLINGDKVLSLQIIETLEIYKAEFTQQNDMRKVAIIILLIQAL